MSQGFLLPMDTGGKIRTGKILEQLVKTNEVTLISNIQSPKDGPYLSQVDRICTRFLSVPRKKVRRYSLVFYARLFFQMFSLYPVSVLNDYCDNLRVVVEREHRQEKYDLAICDFVQSALMFRNIKGIPTVLFQHNVESMIARRHMEQAGNVVERIFWWLQWKKMFSFEERACKGFDTVIAVSDKDNEVFREHYGLDNVVTIPTGVDTDYYAFQSNTPVEEDSLVFCGSMDWLPNEDAIAFFIRDILPGIKGKIPDVTLTVVGRNPSPTLLRIGRDHREIQLTGWVEDTRPYIARSALFIVPIRIGGGTRMKIYEAMAMGKPVVSTSIGAEGLPITSGKNIIIEDDPHKFANAIVDLLKKPEKRAEIGAAGQAFVRKNCAWKHVAEEFANICRKTAKLYKLSFPAGL